MYLISWPSGTSHFSAHHYFKFLCVELGQALFLGDVNLLVARELEPGPAKSLGHSLFVLQFGVDGCDDLATVYPAIIPRGFPKAHHMAILES